MNRDEAEKLIADYAELVDRAIAIFDGSGPPWGYIGNTEYAYLWFDGDEAVITHPEAASDYDCPCIDTREHRFPAALLFMPPDDLAAWKKQTLAEYERAQVERDAMIKARTEAEERNKYEALKRKFEPTAL